jgi:site-specific DNA recombinase
VTGSQLQPYMREFEWNGRIYLGKHQPLVTRDFCDRVQGVLDRRYAKHRRVKYDFAFQG